MHENNPFVPGAGLATINWRADTSIDEWRGVPLGDTEVHVIALELPSIGLNGHIPAVMGTSPAYGPWCWAATG